MCFYVVQKQKGVADAMIKAEIAPILTKLKSRADSPPMLSDRLFIEAVLYRARTGLPWRDLPKDFGRWDAVYNRFRRWEVRGLWRRLWEHLQTEACPSGQPQRF
jgi:transposase